MDDAISPDINAILECLDDPAILLGRDYRILRSNSAYQELYGDEVALESRHCYEVSHRYQVPCDQAGESCPLKQSLETGDNTRVLHIHHTPRGEEYVNVEPTSAWCSRPSIRTCSSFKKSIRRRA